MAFGGEVLIKGRPLPVAGPIWMTPSGSLMPMQATAPSGAIAIAVGLSMMSLGPPGLLMASPAARQMLGSIRLPNLPSAKWIAITAPGLNPWSSRRQLSSAYAARPVGRDHHPKDAGTDLERGTGLAARDADRGDVLASRT